MHSSASSPLITAQGITVRAGGRELLSSVELQVDAGEILTVIGPNGAGKTTLARVLLGILPPDAGAVVRQPGLRIGYVPQRIQMEPLLPLTVKRFLTLRAWRGRPGNAAGYQETLREVGGGHLPEAMLHNLSGGELQRVLLARALMQRPQLLILDEPVRGVDVTGQLGLYELISHLREERGCGILLISHDLHHVMSATDRVLCLNRHVCCAGQPESVARDPAYLELFGSRVAAGLAVYHHAHDHTHGALPAALKE